MRSLSVVVMALSMSACHQPLLQNAPHPDVGTMAGVMAVAAMAATIVDPRGAGRRPEEPRRQREAGPGVMMPGDVLDRLDRALREGGPNHPTP